MYTGFVTSLCLRNSEGEVWVGMAHSSLGMELCGRTGLDIIVSEGTHLEGKRTVSPQQCPV